MLEQFIASNRFNYGRQKGICTAHPDPVETFYLTCAYDWMILSPYHVEDCMKTQTYEVQGNRSHLSQLLKDVSSGTDVIIIKAGKPMALISRIEARKPKIRFGILKGKAEVSEDFDAPLSDDVLSEFERN
jgi:antitoxin (DNA-binding transcriptional repressor) of toxin-antitoxin stability system